MEYLHNLKEKLCRELEEIAQKPELSGSDVQDIHELSDTVKNLLKISMLEHGGYSRDGDWEARGSYDRGNSYNRYGYSQKRDSMGRYSREGRGYSRGDAKGQMMEQMEMAMQSASSEREREEIRRCMERLERA